MILSLLVNLWRCCQGSLNTPASLKSQRKSRLAYSCPSGPFGQMMSLPVKRDVLRYGAINSLSLLGSPSAILRIIPCSAIYSVKREAVWTFAHILKELLKSIPSRADGNSLLHIVAKVFLGISAASPVHTAPLFPSGALLSSQGVSVRRRSTASCTILRSHNIPPDRCGLVRGPETFHRLSGLAILAPSYGA